MGDLVRKVRSFFKDDSSACNSNAGTRNSFNNKGGGKQNFSNAKINSGCCSGNNKGASSPNRIASNGSSAEYNTGTINSFNNHGGHQTFANAKINSGAYSGDGNWQRLPEKEAESSQVRASSHDVGNFQNNSGMKSPGNEAEFESYPDLSRSGEQKIIGLTNQTGYIRGNANGAINFGELRT